LTEKQYGELFETVDILANASASSAARCRSMPRANLLLKAFDNNDVRQATKQLIELA